MGDTIKIVAELSAEGFKKGSDAIKKAVSSLSKTADKFGSNFKKALSSIGNGAKKVFEPFRQGERTIAGTFKRMVPLIIGVGSAFGVIKKAVSAFMAQNQELSGKMNSIWTAFGNLLGPIIERVIGWVTTAVSYLLSFLKLLGVTGKTASQLSKSAKGAGGELQKTIAGFDELNTLQAGGGGSGGATLDDVDPTEWMQKIADLLKEGQFRKVGEEIAAKINEAIAGIDFSAIGEKLSNGFKNALDFFIGFLDGLDFKQIGAKIVQFFESIDWAGIANRIFELLKTAWDSAVELLWGVIAGDSEEKPPIIASLERIGESVDNLRKKLQEFLDKVWKKVWDDVLKPALDWLVNTALPPLINLISGLIDFIGEITENLSGLIDVLSGDVTIEDWFNSMSEGEATVTIIVGLLATLAAGFAAVIAVVEIANVVFGLFSGIMAVVTSPVTLVIAAVAALIAIGVTLYKNWDKIAAWFNQMWQDLAKKCKDTWNDVMELFATIGDWIDMNVIQPVVNYFTGMWNNLINGAASAWNGIRSVFSSVGQFFHDTFSKAWQGIVNIFSVAGELFVNIRDGIKNAFVSIVNQLIGGINKVVTIPFNGINSLLNNLREISILGMKPFSWVGQIAVPQIPYLARGGVLKRGQLGLLEGDGAEAVVPLEKNTEWINKVAEGMLDRLDNGEYSLNAIGKNLSMLNSIAERVAFSMPAVAGGSVVPYSIANNRGGDDTGFDDSSILEAIRELRETIDDLQYALEHMQWIAQFGNIRAIVQEITRVQRQLQRAEGR